MVIKLMYNSADIKIEKVPDTILPEPDNVFVLVQGLTAILEDSKLCHQLVSKYGKNGELYLCIPEDIDTTSIYIDNETIDYNYLTPENREVINNIPQSQILYKRRK